MGYSPRVLPLRRLLHDLANRLNISSMAAQVLIVKPPALGTPELKARLLALREELTTAADVVHRMQIAARAAEIKPISGTEAGRLS